MKRFALIFLMLIIAVSVSAQTVIPQTRPLGQQFPKEVSAENPLMTQERGLTGFIYLAPGSSTFTVGPHQPTRIYLPSGTIGLWINSFNGITLMDNFGNLATGTYFRGVPIASGGGAPFDGLTGTTTPSIALIGNGATTTVTISIW